MALPLLGLVAPLLAQGARHIAFSVVPGLFAKAIHRISVIRRARRIKKIREADSIKKSKIKEKIAEVAAGAGGGGALGGIASKFFGGDETESTQQFADRMTDIAGQMAEGSQQDEEKNVIGLPQILEPIDIEPKEILPELGPEDQKFKFTATEDIPGKIVSKEGVVSTDRVIIEKGTSFKGETDKDLYAIHLNSLIRRVASLEGAVLGQSKLYASLVEAMEALREQIRKQSLDEQRAADEASVENESQKEEAYTRIDKIKDTIKDTVKGGLLLAVAKYGTAATALTGSAILNAVAESVETPIDDEEDISEQDIENITEESAQAAEEPGFFERLFSSDEEEKAIPAPQISQATKDISQRNWFAEYDQIEKEEKIKQTAEFSERPASDALGSTEPAVLTMTSDGPKHLTEKEIAKALKEKKITKEFAKDAQNKLKLRRKSKDVLASKEAKQAAQTELSQYNTTFNTEGDTTNIVNNVTNTNQTNVNQTNVTNRSNVNQSNVNIENSPEVVKLRELFTAVKTTKEELIKFENSPERGSFKIVEDEHGFSENKVYDDPKEQEEYWKLYTANVAAHREYYRGKGDTFDKVEFLQKVGVLPQKIENMNLSGNRLDKMIDEYFDKGNSNVEETAQSAPQPKVSNITTETNVTNQSQIVQQPTETTTNTTALISNSQEVIKLKELFTNVTNAERARKEFENNEERGSFKMVEDEFGFSEDKVYDDPEEQAKYKEFIQAEIGASQQYREQKGDTFDKVEFLQKVGVLPQKIENMDLSGNRLDKMIDEYFDKGANTEEVARPVEQTSVNQGDITSENISVQPAEASNNTTDLISNSPEVVKLKELFTNVENTKNLRASFEDNEERGSFRIVEDEFGFSEDKVYDDPEEQAKYMELVRSEITAAGAYNQEKGDSFEKIQFLQSVGELPANFENMDLSGNRLDTMIANYLSNVKVENKSNLKSIFNQEENTTNIESPINSSSIVENVLNVGKNIISNIAPLNVMKKLFNSFTNESNETNNNYEFSTTTPTNALEAAETTISVNNEFLTRDQIIEKINAGEIEKTEGQKAIKLLDLRRRSKDRLASQETRDIAMNEFNSLINNEETNVTAPSFFENVVNNIKSLFSSNSEVNNEQTNISNNTTNTEQNVTNNAVSVFKTNKNIPSVDIFTREKSETSNIIPMIIPMPRPASPSGANKPSEMDLSIPIGTNSSYSTRDSFLQKEMTT